MEGLKVKCQNCKAICFETTDKYNPDVTPNGSMVRKLVPWEIDWLCSSTTLASEMTCPKCGVGQLALSGRLTVLPEPVPVTPLEIGIPGEFGPPGSAEAEYATPWLAARAAKIARESTEAEAEVAPAFTCEICGKEFETARKLQGHLGGAHKAKRVEK